MSTKKQNPTRHPPFTAAMTQVSNDLEQNGECFASHPQALASLCVSAFEIYLVTHQMYLKGLWNWPIFMLIKVQEMEVSCLKYITAPRKTYCMLSHIFQETIFKSTFNLRAPCFCCCLCYQATGRECLSFPHAGPTAAVGQTWMQYVSLEIDRVRSVSGEELEHQTLHGEGGEGRKLLICTDSIAKGVNI